jgi:predicted amidophosphoribosyltransferase
MNIHCSACGAPLPTGAKVCPACALPLTAIAMPTPAPRKGKVSILAIVLYAVAFVVNAFGFLWVVSRFL